MSLKRSQSRLKQTRQHGFTLVELLVSMVVGGLLLTSLFKIWNTNQMETALIGTKSDFRDKTTLATTRLNHSIMMAGFGMSKMDVIVKGVSTTTDTLKLYTNASEYRTTLRDTAHAYAEVIVVFKDSGFTSGGYLGITDSIHQEFNRVATISGDSLTGFRITLQHRLLNKYLSGVPDIYPVEKEIYYIDLAEQALVRYVDDRRLVLATDISEFRVNLLDGAGNPASSYRSIRVVSFSLAGSYHAPEGRPNLMRFSSTVIPRNIL